MEFLNNDTKEHERYERAVRHVKKIKGFYSHLLVYLLVNVFMIFGSVYVHDNSDRLFQIQTYYTALFWGVGLLAHGLSVFGISLFLSEQWEENKIKKLMDKENNR
jgi:hypothetical protein